MEKALRFTSVECERNDIVKVASIGMEILPDLYKVNKKSKNTVYLVRLNSDEKPIAWHKSRVVEVISKEEKIVGETTHATAMSSESNQIIFDLDQYLSTFNSGYELWMMKRKTTHTNILIESDKQSFWYLRQMKAANLRKSFLALFLIELEDIVKI